MARNVTQYDLLISCPGDIQDELGVIEEAVNAFNNTYSDVLGISLRTKHWSKDSFSQSGDKPQNLINKQFVLDCDAAIALFWTRFGSPTDRYGSGTEEEIEEMLAANKQVFMYFSDKALNPSSMISKQDQYLQIQKFKDRYKERGLYFGYSSNEELKKLLTAHLGKYFLSFSAVSELACKKSVLAVKGITDRMLTDSVTPSAFYPTQCETIDNMLGKIEGLIEKIREYKVSDNKAWNTNIDFIKAIKLSDSVVDTIRNFGEIRHIAIDDAFFDLGSLHENEIESMKAALSMNGRRTACGDEDEKKKYNALLRVSRKINELANWLSVMETYSNLRCIKLAIQNSGTTYDEDIEITLEFPKDTILLPHSIPAPQADVIEFFLDDCDPGDFFGIPSSATYLHYESSQTQTGVQRNARGISYFPNTRNFSDEFDELINDVFPYNIYTEQETVKVKVCFDYVKHNTSVAFPSVLFVAERMHEIRYSITSKHNESIATGTISSST